MPTAVPAAVDIAVSPTGPAAKPAGGSTQVGALPTQYGHGVITVATLKDPGLKTVRV